jgi:peroxiredoxin family protein
VLGNELRAKARNENNENKADRDDGELAALVRGEVERQIVPVRADLERQLGELRERTVDNRATLVVFSGDLDKVLAAFVIATGAASMGMDVSMFFTFWGLPVLRRREARRKPKDIYERLFGAMTPRSLSDLDTSKMSFFGAGAAMLRRAMKNKGVSSVEELMTVARDAGVKMIACGMSMDVMGVKAEELLDGVELGGVATYLGDAAQSRVTLFI